jgi:hypothetical protein
VCRDCGWSVLILQFAFFLWFVNKKYKNENSALTVSQVAATFGILFRHRDLDLEKKGERKKRERRGKGRKRGEKRKEEKRRYIRNPFWEAVTNSAVLFLHPSHRRQLHKFFPCHRIRKSITIFLSFFW